MLRFRIAKNTEVYKTVCAAKENRVTAYPAVTLCHFVAGPTRLELATSGVTGRRSNQLNYDPAISF